MAFLIDNGTMHSPLFLSFILLNISTLFANPPRTLKDLSPEVVEDLTLDQTRNNYMNDTEIYSDLGDFRNVLPKNYWPENQPEIPLKTYLLEPKDVDIYAVDPLPPQFLTADGKIRFFVHPLSDAHYQKHSYFSRRSTESKYIASPYASHRSMVVWDATNQDPSFDLKLSLSAEIGGLLRNLTEKEVKHSVAVAALLKGLQTPAWRKEGINFVLDTVGIVPKGTDAGMLHRNSIQLPPGSKAVSLFSLFSPPKGGGEPMVVTLCKQSRLKPMRFVRKFFIDPMNKQAARRYFKEGIVSEDHEQNVKAEIKSGKLNGQFWYKDLGAVRIDSIARHAAGKDMSFLPAWATNEDVGISRQGFLTQHSKYVRDSTMYALAKAMRPYFPTVTVATVKKEWQESLADAVMEHIAIYKPQTFRALIHSIEDWRKAHVPPGGIYKPSITATGCVGVLARIWGEI